MFLRFTKGARIKGTEKRIYTKSVFLGDEVVMEHGDQIVGVAAKQCETDKSVLYHLWVATKNELCAASIARSIKNLIGKSNKFCDNPSLKRRRYVVEQVEVSALPVRAGITINNLI